LIYFLTWPLNAQQFGKNMKRADCSQLIILHDVGPTWGRASE